MTWQKFYELYDLYGPFHDIWNKYLGITTNGVFSFKDMFNVFKSLDMNEVQKPKNRLSFISVWWRLKLLQTNISAATRL